MVPYVDAVVAVTLMRVQLFVLHVCILRECEGDGNAGVGDGGGVVSSVIVSTATVVLVMSAVRGMRGVGGVCEICMCLGRGSVGGEGAERIGFGLYQSCGNRGECWTRVCVWVVVVWVV